MPLLMLLLCSCGNEEDGSGGSFFAVIENNPENLDPQTACDKESLLVIKNIYATLTDTDGNGEVICGAADSFTVSDNGLKYTFNLRSGLVWKGLDGNQTPLTADDYVYAFERIYTAETCSPYRDFFSCIKNSDGYYENRGELGVYATDSKTVVFELSYPNCDFPLMLSHPAASPCCEELFLSTQGRYGLSAEDTYSCGAFYLTDWNYDPYWTENHIVLDKISANSLENYRTYPDSIRIDITSDVKAAEAAEGVLVDSYAVSDISLYDREAERNYYIREYSCGTSFLMFSPDSPMASSRQARLALSSVIDRSKWGENIEQASGIFPLWIKTGGVSIREMYPDRSALPAVTAPENIWSSFAAQYPETDFNSFTMLVSDDFDPDTANSVISDFEERLDFYCLPVFEDAAGYEKKLAAGEYDMRICTVSSEYALAECFAEEFLREASVSEGELWETAAKLSACSDNSSKCACADKLEEEMRQEAYALPLCYESRYLLTLNGSEDIFYDPCGDILYFKYAKKFD